MSDLTIRPAYRTWPTYNERLRDVVATMTVEQLAISPSPDRWPLWASVGHRLPAGVLALRLHG